MSDGKPNPRKRERFWVRVTEAEYKQWRAITKALGMTSGQLIDAYVREFVKGKTPDEIMAELF